MPTGFPFDVPVVRTLETIELSSPVTFFVGENGSGKSTLLEAMALAAELPTVGSDEIRSDATLALMQDMIAEDGQFVIATHSPILLAFPGATIYTFDRAPPEQIAFENLEHVNLTRAFLNNPGSYLRRLT
jgi:predicted ATPase